MYIGSLIVLLCIIIVFLLNRTFNKKKEILVIGSSPNLLNIENGNKIDKYKYICRFNDYKI